MTRQAYYDQLKTTMKGNVFWKKTVASQFKKGHPNWTPSGIQNPGWKYGIIGGKTWNTWRLAVLKKYKMICQRCGGVADIAHHKKHYRDFPALKFVIENGLAVCRSCHPLYHPELIKNLT